MFRLIRKRFFGVEDADTSREALMRGLICIVGKH